MEDYEFSLDNKPFTDICKEMNLRYTFLSNNSIVSAENIINIAKNCLVIGNVSYQKGFYVYGRYFYYHGKNNSLQVRSFTIHNISSTEEIMNSIKTFMNPKKINCLIYYGESPPYYIIFKKEIDRFYFKLNI